MLWFQFVLFSNQLYCISFFLEGLLLVEVSDKYCDIFWKAYCWLASKVIYNNWEVELSVRRMHAETALCCFVMIINLTTSPLNVQGCIWQVCLKKLFKVPFDNFISQEWSIARLHCKCMNTIKVPFVWLTRMEWDLTNNSGMSPILRTQRWTHTKSKATNFIY